MDDLTPAYVVAPVGAYNFKMPEHGNDYMITKIEDLEIIPSDKLVAFMAERNLNFTLQVNPKRFTTHCDIIVMIVFENDTDAVMFKLQWED